MNYIAPIKTALIVFPIIALIGTLPFLLYEYRKYGSIPILRSFIVYSFVFYLLSAFFLTLLPLPSKEVVSQMTFNPVQIIPFNFIKDFLRETKLVIKDPSTYLVALRQNVFIQPFFNILLLLPLGVYLRYYFKLSFIKTIILSFLLSLFFEITQLTGIYGIYPRAYRIFDIDDLFLNTLGGIIGYGITPALVFFLPKREDIDKKAYEIGKSVSMTRRGLGAIIDRIIITIFTFIISIVLNYIFEIKINAYFHILINIINYILLSYLMNGATFGKRMLKIKVINIDGEVPSIRELFERYMYLYILLPLTGIILNNLLSNSINWEGTKAYPFILFGGLSVFAIYILVYIILIFYFILRFMQNKGVLFYENWSDTRLISTIEIEE